MKKPELVGLIASRNPAEALILTVQSLLDGGCDKVLVVNDGSDSKESSVIFNTVRKKGQVAVLDLAVNGGKSAALRAGFAHIPKGSIIVQTDDDTLASDLRIAKKLIVDGKADIVDIRIEAMITKNLIGITQELCYWMTNIIIKRIQSFLKARTWMSGASVMYSYKAGAVILEDCVTMAEDTEGLYRALGAGFRLKLSSDPKGQFTTMVPDNLRDLHKQWLRWCTGNGQLIPISLIAGPRVVLMNLASWGIMLSPFVATAYQGSATTMLMVMLSSILFGILGAIKLRRPLLMIAGLTVPILAFLWLVQSFMGLYIANNLRRSGTKQMTWVSPKRVAVEI